VKWTGPDSGKTDASQKTEDHAEKQLKLANAPAPQPSSTSREERTVNSETENRPASTESGASPYSTPQSAEVRRAAPVMTPTINPPQDSVEIPSQRTLNGERYPQTRQRLLTLDNLKGLSASEVRYAINEIYARYGATFPNHPDVQQQFQKFDWYHPEPKLTFEDIDQSMSDFERENVRVLAQYRTTAWQSLAGTPPIPVPVLTDEQSTAAFNMLQDGFGKPHAKRVWYNKKADSYQWIGPREGKTMSMPRTQFEAEIVAPYLKQQ
jgi:hypothetical protein